jgi:hypothetical protein
MLHAFLTNGSLHVARTSEATMIKTTDRVLGVHCFVIWIIVLLGDRPIED